MADSPNFTFLLFFLLSLLVHITLSADPPQTSPAPSPHSGADLPSPASPAPASAPTAHAPASSPLASSPPAPLADNSSPGSSPSPSASPAPADGSAISHTGVVGDEEKADDSSGGMSGGKKAGIVIGVIGAAFVVGLAGVVYKKRQQNIRRSQYGYAARRELL